MKSSRRKPSIFSNLILFAGLVIIWIAFAPIKIGGQASYVMVNGISMEPNYHTGDLVIVRAAETYQIGDVATYRDAEMGAYVIHRIIGVEQDQFVLKGDNNSWTDAYQPTHAEIIGKQWIYMPKAGQPMQWLRKPANVSLIIFLLGGILMTTMITKPPMRQNKRRKRPAINSGGMFEGALYLLGFLFLGFLGLSIFAFIKPATRAADNIPYQQDSNYFYSATGKPGVYDTEMARSGEPVFPRLTCFLNIGFTYSIPGDQLQNIAGTHQMFARVMDVPSGWQRTIPLIPQTVFSGNSYFAMTALDLCQLESLVNLVEKETGLRANTYTVEIVTNIAFTASASGQAIADTFNPVLVFKYDKVHLYLANTNNQTDSMHIMKEGRAGSSNLEANTLPFLGWEPTVRFVRVFAMIGFGASFIALALMGLFIFNTTNQGEEAIIRLRYGAQLIDVYEQSLNAAQPVIDITSIDDLAKMADRQNTMMTHMTLNFIHYYMVQGNGVTYRYMFRAGKSGIAENTPARQEVIEYIPNSNEYIYDTTQPLHREATSIHPDRTVLLGKIKF